MAQVLNIDDIFETEKRELVLAGKTYAIQEMSVEDYLDSTKTAKRLDGNEDEELQMRETTRLICRQVPGLAQESLLGLSLPKLFAIAEFVRGAKPEDIIARVSGGTTAAAESTAEGEKGNG